MQLLMFFILCADLKQANRKNPFVALPAAAAAIPASPSGEGIVYVNVMPYKAEDYAYLDEAERATHPGRFKPPLPGGQTICYILPSAGNRNPMNEAEFESKMKDLITVHNNAVAKGAKLPDMSVVVRAAGVVQYGYVLETLQYCKKQTFVSQSGSTQPLKTVITVNTRQRANQ